MTNNADAICKTFSQTDSVVQLRQPIRDYYLIPVHVRLTATVAIPLCILPPAHCQTVRSLKMPKLVRKTSKAGNAAAAAAAAAHDSLRFSPLGLHLPADPQCHGCPHLAALKMIPNTKTSSASGKTAPGTLPTDLATNIAPAGQELMANYRSCVRYSLSYSCRSDVKVNRKVRQYKIMCQLDDEDLPAVEGKKRKRNLGWIDKEIHAFEKLPAPVCSTCKLTALSDRLHACLECVFIGCFSSRKPHLSDHTKQTGHKFVMDWEKFTVFCIPCNKYVYDGDLERIVRAEQERMDYIISRVKEPNLKKPRLATWIPSNEELVQIQTKSSIAECSGLRGCVNLGNTCFMNAILQVMIHNPIMKYYFLSEKHTKETCERKAPHCMACHMDNVFQEFYSGERRPFGPNAFLHAMWMSQKEMAGYSQQDAHEFFISLANELHNNCTSQNKAPSATAGTNGTDADCNCIIHETFAGLLQSDVTCSSCHAVSSAFDPIIDMSLELKRSRPATKANGKRTRPGELPPTLPGDAAAAGAAGVGSSSSAAGPPPAKKLKVAARDPADSCSLMECLDRYTVPEKLEYTCSQCNEKKEATKQISIKKLPAILSIQLKRFEHSHKSSSKIETAVKIPAELDMTPYTTRAIKLRSLLRPTSAGQRKYSKGSAFIDSGPTDNIPAHKYELFAVIHHSGKLETGHYTTYARVRDKWFKFNDQNVTFATEEEVSAGEAYMIFYSRRGQSVALR
ncbi:Ubiquitin carboxyl-terminal hydrolase 22 [Geranomyces michiganensis]|nr:Ubiquitin carboxyl-terminal hydrolase 22 [Geranomyces michiganensis]